MAFSLAPLLHAHSPIRDSALSATARSTGSGSSAIRLRQPRILVASAVPERHEGVAPQPARVVPWDEEPVELARQPLLRLPRASRRATQRAPRRRRAADRRAASRRRGSTGRRPGRCRSRRRDPRGHPSRRRGSLPPSASSRRGNGSRRARRARSERSRRARVDAERAAPAAGVERRRRLELDVGDERPEHDPRPVGARDQHRVLADEADARALGARAVDVLVGVHEHPVAPPSRRPSISRRSRRSA